MSRFRFLLMVILLIAPAKPTPARPGSGSQMATATPVPATATLPPAATRTQPAAPAVAPSGPTEIPAPTRTAAPWPVSTEIVQITLDSTFPAPAAIQRRAAPSRTPLLVGAVLGVLLVAVIIFTIMRRGRP